MREILFRIKCENKWYFGMPLSPIKGDKESCVFQSEDNSYYDIFADIKTLGQFTGLTDKNNKKIFEGDIVKDKFGRTMQIKYNNNRYRLMFYLVNFELNWTDNFICADFDGWTESSIEVIGNIYDNPELLRKIEQFGNSEQLKNKEKEC